jgi:hypothetical protein
MHVKGTFFVGRKAFIIQQFGEARWSRFIERIAKKEPIFGEPILVTSLVPVEAYLSFQDELIQDLFGGDNNVYWTIGEKSAEIRRRICESASWLGIALDEGANERHESRITHPKAAVSAWVIPTNEELMIARHTWDLLGLA